jgi:hypothetical protein
MPFSYNSYTGDGSTEFAITFNYLTETVVVDAEPKGIEVHLNAIRQNSGYTIDTSLNKVTFTTAPETGVNIKILRVTPRGKADRLVDFADGTIITEAQLDSMGLQLLYIAQEAFEQSNSGGGGAPIYLPYNEEGPYWDAVQGGATQTIKNLKLPVSDDAASTKKYVDDVATWGISGVPQQWTFTADGTTNTFTLLDGPYIEEEMLVVAIDGALQIPNTDFNVSQDDVSSILIFDATPGADTTINVQNFGKMRFLDGVNLADGSVTTAKLDQTVGTEAVDTVTIRDDAVTIAKIADKSVDFARLNDLGFTADSNSNSTPRYMQNPPGVDNVEMDVLRYADMVDFHTGVRTNRLNEMAVPNANVSWNSKKIISLATPTSNSDAATKKYVDDEVLAAYGEPDLVKLKAVELGVSSTTFEITGWEDNSLYAAYEFECTRFTHQGEGSDNAFISMHFRDENNVWVEDDDDGYGVLWVVNTPLASAFAVDCTESGGGSASTYMGAAGWNYFKLQLHTNRRSENLTQQVLSTGHGSAGLQYNTIATVRPGGYAASYAFYNILTSFLARPQHAITGIRFKVSVNARNNVFDGRHKIDAGARVTVYGRAF